MTALEAAAASGIGLIAMKTQCGGGGNWAREPDGQGEIRSLNHTALLKWVLRHPFITTAIPGYTTFEQMEQRRLGRARPRVHADGAGLPGAREDPSRRELLRPVRRVPRPVPARRRRARR